MPKRATRLTAVGVANAPPGKKFDGDGLILDVQSATVAYWLYRFTMAGRTREAGLGRARGPNSVSLAQARAKGAELRARVKNGIDPLAQREAAAAEARAAAQAEKTRAITFRAVARFYLDAHDAKWRSPKHGEQWRRTLESFVMPHMGDLPVANVGTAHVLAVLEPIWREKPETAQRVRGRIEMVLDYAKTREWRAGENPARWRGHLANLLPARAMVAPVRHHPALPISGLGDFMAKLRTQAGTAARALEFAILTAARSGEARGCRWAEIDMATNIWTVPAARMKAGKEHRVPLSEAALGVLQAMAPLRLDADLVFPGLRPGRPLSDASLIAVLRRMGGADLTVHGFRSTFRDWCGESTSYPRERAEAALAHAVGDKVEAAYRRGDLFEKRRRLMEEWGEFCARPSLPAGEVLSLRRA